MQTVQKQDLLNSYDYKTLVQKQKQENKKWQWIILIGCFLMQMIPACIVINLNGVLSGADWSQWLHENPTLYVGLTFTIGSIISAIAGPFIAKIFAKKINMRLVYSLGICTAMIGFMGYSINAILTKVYGHIPNLSTTLPILWIMYAISQIGTMIFSGIGINNLISRWWPPQKRGFALGIAFAGGSFGNIWMQQLVKVLTENFGNVPGNNYNFSGNQFATYLILGSMGLICGLIVVMFICRKPIPSVEILNDQQFNQNITNNNIQTSLNVNAVTPLNVRKYPPYWILCIGFLFIQMGTIHSSASGLIIRNTVCFSQPDKYAAIMATGGTIFGVSALIGNISGGIINDKAGPWRSITYAGILQVVAILCLMFSIRAEFLVYIYYLIAGLSSYLYISTPGFVNGRLYGAKYSNMHVSIMSIFTALGFAVSNSIMGALTGPVKIQGELLGRPTGGNFVNLLSFAMITMGIGVIITVICCFIIQRKGIEGLKNFISSRYTIAISKYALYINLRAKFITILNKDFRNNPKWFTKIDKKNQSDKYYHCFNQYQAVIYQAFKDEDFSEDELKVMAYIYFYKIMNIGRLKKYTKIVDYAPIVNRLIDNHWVNIISLNRTDNIYSLSKQSMQLIQHQTKQLNDKFPKIANENESIARILKRVQEVHNLKIMKLEAKLNKVKAIEIDQTKLNQAQLKANKKIDKLKLKHQMIAKKYQSNPWACYQKEYFILDKIQQINGAINKVENKKQSLIAKINRQIDNIETSWIFYNTKEAIGHDLLINYYNNKYLVINHLITKKVNKILSTKINNITHKIDKQQANYNKIFKDHETSSRSI